MSDSRNTSKRRTNGGSSINRESYRKMLRRKKRRRKLLLRRIRFALVSLIIVCLTIFLSVKLVSGIHSMLVKGSGGEKEAANNIIARSIAERQNMTQEPSTEPPVVIPKPVRSDAFQETVSDKINSEKIILVDVENHSIIGGKDYEGQIYPASMTKVMTLICAVEHIQNLDDTFIMTAELVDPLVQENASRAGFDPGERVNAKDMLYGLILPSGADAAVGIANMVSGSEEAFVKLMNDKCKAMGLTHTHFTNTSGLHSDNQYTTLAEMAMIMEYAMMDPLCAEILSTYQYTTQATPQHPEGIELTSTMYSRMYGNEAEGVLITAGKTGYTVEAGNCMVSYAEKQGHHYILVTAQASGKWIPIYDAIEIYGKYLP